MSKQGLIYQNARPVAKARHAKWKVKRDGTFKFARDLNAVPLTVAEFAVAARDYPIVFTPVGESYSATALLGLRDGENVFVNEDGTWDGRYVPAFLRRYPFVFFHNAEKKQYTLCIDEASDAVGESIAGDQLFGEDGEETEFLKSMLGFSTSFQRSFQDTSAFCERLQELGLVDGREIRFDLPDGQRAATRGLAVVDGEKLAELDPEVVSAMLKSGDLALVHAQLLSLRNVEDLAARIPGESRILN